MVTYRLANPDDYENINAFHNRIYKSNRTMEQFRWEFHDGPFGKSIYVIAEDEGKVIGTNCVIPIDLVTSDNQIIRSGKSEDTLVDPDYRGQKIFYKIYDFLFEKSKEEGIRVIWGFTSAKKPFRNLGFEIPYDHQQSLAVNHIGKSYSYLASLNPKNKFKDRVKILGLCFLSKTKAIGKLSPKKLNYRIEQGAKVVKGVDELIFKNQQVSESFSIQQTPEYQDWRIYQNPNYFKTHTYGVYRNDDLIALIVFNSHPNKVAYLCQSIFDPDIADSEKVKIFRSVTGMLFKEGIALVRSWLFDTNLTNRNEMSVYKDAGYINLDRGVGLVWKELGETGLEPKQFILSRIATQGVI